MDGTGLEYLGIVGAEEHRLAFSSERQSAERIRSVFVAISRARLDHARHATRPCRYAYSSHAYADAMATRWAQASDKNGVLELLAASAAAEGVRLSQRSMDATWDAALCAEPRVRFVVAIAEDRLVVGLMSLQRLFSTYGGAPSVEIQDVYVRPSMRRRGFARELLAFADDYARSIGACTCQLSVRDDNSVAMRAYRASGFTEIPYRVFSKSVVLAVERPLGGASSIESHSTGPAPTTLLTDRGLERRTTRRGACLFIPLVLHVNVHELDDGSRATPRAAPLWD
jgi:ribosomal protein S18 acetylase RimI-like enzyme